MNNEELREATLRRLDLLDERVGAEVATMGATNPASMEPLRGLYISDEHARQISASEPDRATMDSMLGPIDPVLSEWADRIGLDDLEFDLLLIAAAPDVDRRFEQLYGYLHDDITRRRATAGLALRLNGQDVTDPDARRLLSPTASLVTFGLVEVEETDRPFLTRSLRVPDRVVLALLGDERPARTVTVLDDVELSNEWVHRLSAAALGGSQLVHIVDHPDHTALALATSALVYATGEAVIVRIAEGMTEWRVVLADAVREAILRGCGLVINSLDSVIDASPELIYSLASLPRPVVLVGHRSWEPEWSEEVPLTLEAPGLGRDERNLVWQQALAGRFGESDIDGATSTFRLGPERIRRAADAAKLSADFRDGQVATTDIQRGARQQNGSGLRRLARRIEPSADWSDLVLADEALSSVREVAARVRFRSFVLDEWGLRRGGGRGEGITALFAGPSGTGKTLAAEVIAHELGVDLNTVDLATVVDKYIGETEKNLDRIFTEAERVNTVLFFDEADALFGKRSEVKDARDRYANVEVAYLLQRMERFDGPAILATNLRLNIDDAFARRLDLIVDFPKPSAHERERLWKVLVGKSLPLAADVDFEEIAESFELCGGDIRNAVSTAAYLAAERGDVVGMADLIKGVAREYRKLGRLCLPHEFGDWFDILEPALLEGAVSFEA